MPWVKFMQPWNGHKAGEVFDLPSYETTFQLKNKGIVVRVNAPIAKPARASKRLGAKKKAQ